MLKSVFNGIGGGFGRIIGKFIGLGVIGYIAYTYIQNNNISINNAVSNVEEAIWHEKS